MNFGRRESIRMRRIACMLAVLAAVFGSAPAFAMQYGELYDIEWCPCNPDDQYDANGSVVLGKTVMCPCDSMYDGYNSTMEKDVRKLQHKTKQTLERAKNFKYYVGFDYNKSQLTSASGSVNFNHQIFSQSGGLDVPVDTMLDDQDNIGIVLGTRPHANFGIEIFYNRSYDDNKVTQIDNTTLGSTDYHMVNTYISKYQAYGIDFLGYLPVTDYFDFIAFVGLGQYHFDNEARFESHYLESGNQPAVDSADFDFSEDKLAWRVGIGAQFNIARGLVLRSMYRYIRLNTDTIDYLQEFSVGLRFLF